MIHLLGKYTNQLKLLHIFLNYANPGGGEGVSSFSIDSGILYLNQIFFLSVMINDVFPSNDNRLLYALIIDIIIQFICPFLIGFLAGFFITLTILSKNYKHTKYYRNRKIISSCFGIILGIISFYVLINSFQRELYHITSIVFTLLGLPH